jgi:hypothetical protein
MIQPSIVISFIHRNVSKAHMARIVTTLASLYIYVGLYFLIIYLIYYHDIKMYYRQLIWLYVLYIHTKV